jgi:hypothetical protein
MARLHTFVEPGRRWRNTGAANSRLLLTIRYFESPSDPACCQGFPGATVAAPRLESTESESRNLPKKLQGAPDNMWLILAGLILAGLILAGLILAA